MRFLRLITVIATVFVGMSPIWGGDMISYDLIPPTNKPSQHPATWSNVANWSSLSTVDPGAGCATCYGRMFWPAAMSSGPTVWARFAMASPGEARLYSYYYPNEGGPPVFDYDWPAVAAVNCVCYLTVDVTAKWNAIVNGVNRQTGIFVQVKGSSVALYQARVEVLKYP